MNNLADSASFDSEDRDAPSKPGIKHLDTKATIMPTRYQSKVHSSLAAIVPECHSTGMTTGASLFFSSTTINFAGLDVLALRLTK
ncbi:hypothetical protein SAMN02927900_04882 [Rhizobium mongolense subsp. loessense]|uniref:Uncharacterized protein n=1 Tax=Rhizobium mongolense subsp. loessense TaxID=158890 RepID=A0A1G4T8Z2_9HYPH|nr:hypothetical protein SAMN02927900_04882 [Rhizobium mongolense subsp. loessense]